MKINRTTIISSGLALQLVRPIQTLALQVQAKKRQSIQQTSSSSEKIKRKLKKNKKKLERLRKDFNVMPATTKNAVPTTLK